MAIKRTVAEKLLATQGNLVEASVNEIPQGFVALVSEAGKLELAIVSEKDSTILKTCAELTYEDNGELFVGKMPMNANNAALVRRYVKGAGTIACGVKGISVGFCDWLGITTPVLPKMFTGRQLRPVLVEYTAENSAVLKRNFLEAVDTATWSVLESGYKSGYGAKATGLKNEEDIVKALLYGYTMIGLDCRDKINMDIETMEDAAVDKKFAEFPMEFRAALRASYLNVEFKVGNSKLKYNETQLERIVLEFGEAIMYVQSIYNTYLKDTPWDIDFEISMSKLGKMLTPEEHYLIANELQRNGVKLATICMNTAAEKALLEESLKIHAEIADTYNYRLSLGNADLSFRDLGAVAKTCAGKVHFKMNNVLWLAALQTVAATDKDLMEQIAAAAGLEVVAADRLLPDTLEGARYAMAYDKILKAEEGKAALPVKAVVEKHLNLYEANVSDLVGPFLKSL